MTVPEDKPTRRPKLLGSLAIAAMPNMTSSERLHNETSAEETEETTAGSTACINNTKLILPTLVTHPVTVVFKWLQLLQFYTCAAEDEAEYAEMLRARWTTDILPLYTDSRNVGIAVEL